MNFEDPNGFFAEFNKRYPGQWGAVSWEYASVMDLWKAAAEKAGSAEPEAVIAAMKEGGTGKHAFGDARWWGTELFGIDNALQAGWRRRDLMWEALMERGCAAWAAGKTRAAGWAFLRARLIAWRFGTGDLRRAASEAALGVVTHAPGRMLRAQAMFARHAEAQIAAMQIAPRPQFPVSPAHGGAAPRHLSRQYAPASDADSRGNRCLPAGDGAGPSAVAPAAYPVAG